jgi:translation elongation factor EF-1alpha
MHKKYIFCAMKLDVAIYGVSGTGKSTVVGCLLKYIHEKFIPASVTGIDPEYVFIPKLSTISSSTYRCLTDRLPAEMSHGHSERWSIVSIAHDSNERRDLIIVPGKRQFWKWTDFGLTDSDTVCIILPPTTDDIPINHLIEPIAHALSFGVSLGAIIVHFKDLIDPSTFEIISGNIKKDLRKVFDPKTAETIPIWSTSLASVESIDSLCNNLRTIPGPTRKAEGSIQVSITTIHEKDGSLILGGKIREGSLKLGDRLFLMPANIPVHVEEISVGGRTSTPLASAGDVAGIRVCGLDRRNVSTGMVLVSDPSIGSKTRRVRVEVNLFNLKHPMKAGFCPMVCILACQVHSRVIEIEGEKQELRLGDTAVVKLEMTKAIYAQVFSPIENRPFSRLVFRQENVVIAVGVIREFLD